MPEGDTLFRTATTLRSVLEGRAIEAAEVRDKLFSPASLIGRVVNSVEARGKHLLLHLDDERSIHTHLGMTGSWHIYAPGQAWQKPERLAAIVLQNCNSVIPCFSPKVLELLSPLQLRQHIFISRLGPDILAAGFSIEQALLRFRSMNHLPIGEAVMHQGILCGIGNIYKSETLFLAKVHPLIRVATLTDDNLRHVIKTARQLMQKNLHGYPRRTRFGRGGEPHWTYGRGGDDCFICGETIQVTRQGDLGRTTYFCLACQPNLPESNSPS